MVFDIARNTAACLARELLSARPRLSKGVVLGFPTWRLRCRGVPRLEELAVSHHSQRYAVVIDCTRPPCRASR